MAYYRSDSTVMCIRWNDNYTITIANNFYDMFLIQKTKKEAKKKQNTPISQTYLLKICNQEKKYVIECFLHIDLAFDQRN